MPAFSDTCIQNTRLSTFQRTYLKWGIDLLMSKNVFISFKCFSHESVNQLRLRKSLSWVLITVPFLLCQALQRCPPAACQLRVPQQLLLAPQHGPATRSPCRPLATLLKSHCQPLKMALKRTGLGESSCFSFSVVTVSSRVVGKDTVSGNVDWVYTYCVL